MAPIIGLRVGACAVALATGLTLVQPVAAQESKSETSSNAGDIIVTARRIEERLQDVPISITVFNQTQLTDRNVVNAEDLATFTPSLSVNSAYGSDNTSFAIRGFNQDTGTAPSVGVYFAEVVAPRGTANSGINSGDGAGPGSFFDLQNVQVLKGPQGTLFGRNTTGGAVLLVPQRPTDSFEGYVEGSVGNYDLRRAQAVVNAPLGETARLRIAVDHNRRDGYQKNISGIGPKDFANLDYTAVRASLIVDLTPQLENYTIASYVHSKNNGAIEPLFACDPAGIFGTLACAQLEAEKAMGADFYSVQNPVADPYSKLVQWQVINTTTWIASDALTIKNIASYAEARNSTRVNYTGTLWQVAPGQPVAFSIIESPPGKGISSQYTFTDELQFQGTAAAGRLNWQAGGYFEYSGPLGSSGIASQVLLACQDGTSVGMNCTDPLGIGTTAQVGVPVHIGAISSSLAQTTFRNVGVYGQGSFKIADALTLTAGARYTWDRQSTSNRRLSFIFPVEAPFTDAPIPVCFDASTTANDCSYDLEQKSSKPTWVVGLDYKPLSDLLLYAKYTRGYRAGGVRPNSPIGYREIEPEKVDSYEIGSKWSFRGAIDGYLNLAAFYNDFSNQQIFVGFSAVPGSGASPTNAIVNAGKSRIYGAEAEASLTPFDGFSISASYTYLNATIREIAPLVSTDPNYTISAAINPGDDLLLSPRHKASVTASYQLPLDESLGTVTLAATYSYTARQLSNYDFNNPALLAAYGRNLAELDERNLLSLNLSWNSVGGSPFDAAVFATNVTNQKYYTYVASLGTLGFMAGTVGQPRMYGLRLRYNFGD